MRYGSVIKQGGFVVYDEIDERMINACPCIILALDMLSMSGTELGCGRRRASTTMTVLSSVLQTAALHSLDGLGGSNIDQDSASITAGSSHFWLLLSLQAKITARQWCAFDAPSNLSHGKAEHCSHNPASWISAVTS